MCCTRFSSFNRNWSMSVAENVTIGTFYMVIESVAKKNEADVEVPKIKNRHLKPAPKMSQLPLLTLLLKLPTSEQKSGCLCPGRKKKRVVLSVSNCQLHNSSIG